MSNTTVYHGVWHNHSTNTLTLTLSSVTGGLLTNALVIWIGWVATQFWKSIRYLVHQINAGQGERDYLHHQKQAALRNSGSPESLFATLRKLWAAWRKPKPRGLGMLWAFWRLITLIAVALVYFIGIEAAKLLSSFIYTKSGDDVLITSPFCGYGLIGNNTNSGTDYELLVLNQTITAETYVAQCYVPSPDPFKCGYLPQAQIKWTGNNTRCPFASDNICLVLAYQVDSGYMDSDHDLGINAAPSNRVQIRKLATCSPIHGKPFVTYANASDTDQAQYWPAGTQFVYLNLGPVKGNANWTFRYIDWQALVGFPYDVQYVLPIPVSVFYHTHLHMHTLADP
jgi:hypothetical protein